MKKENDEGVLALADALALAHNAMDQLDAPWTLYVQQTINRALSAVLALHEAQNLSDLIIDVQEKLINKTVEERDHWKANHDAMVRRARVLVERTDMPIERVRAFEYQGELFAALAECRDIAAMDDENDDLYRNANADPLRIPAYVRAQFNAKGKCNA